MTGLRATRMNNIGSLSTEELVARFAEIGIAQYNANLDLDTRRYNGLFDQMIIISDELKRRPGDHRRYLSSLYQHPNTKVRAKAAIIRLQCFPKKLERCWRRSAA